MDNLRLSYTTTLANCGFILMKGINEVAGDWDWFLHKAELVGEVRQYQACCSNTCQWLKPGD